jgi:hypothetical protein
MSRDPFRKKSRLHRVIIITLPLGGSVISAFILAAGFVAASAVFPVSRIMSNAVAMAVSLIAIATIVTARKQIQRFKADAVEWLREIKALDTEDPERAESDTSDVIRLPDRRNTSGS